MGPLSRTLQLGEWVDMESSSETPGMWRNPSLWTKSKPITEGNCARHWRHCKAIN